jgi:hypothetical protein
MTRRKIEYWVIPPEADAEFVAGMEGVPEHYEKAYDFYKEISPSSILVSVGQTTGANLFYNMARRQVGLVDCGMWWPSMKWRASLSRTRMASRS